MSLKINSGFSLGVDSPIDERLVLTKTEMLNMNDNIMPEVYMCACKDDGKLYVYNKNNQIDVALGKFREISSVGHIVDNVAPNDKSILWIDNTDATNPIIKYYDYSTTSWVEIGGKKIDNIDNIAYVGSDSTSGETVIDFDELHIVDDLTSTATDKALSANMGKVLFDKIGNGGIKTIVAEVLPYNVNSKTYDLRSMLGTGYYTQHYLWILSAVPDTNNYSYCAIGLVGSNGVNILAKNSVTQSDDVSVSSGNLYFKKNTANELFVKISVLRL